MTVLPKNYQVAIFELEENEQQLDEFKILFNYEFDNILSVLVTKPNDPIKDNINAFNQLHIRNDLQPTIYKIKDFETGSSPANDHLDYLLDSQRTEIAQLGNVARKYKLFTLYGLIQNQKVTTFTTAKRLSATTVVHLIDELSHQLCLDQPLDAAIEINTINSPNGWSQVTTSIN